MGCCKSVQEPVVPPEEKLLFKHASKDEASSAEVDDHAEEVTLPEPVKVWPVYALPSRYAQERRVMKAIDTFHLVLKERPANLEAFKGRSYLGHIKPEARVCWVSFPGKFQAGWESLISDRNEDSIACVFLDDPEHGLGQHYFPDPLKPRQCLCAQIYGERDCETFGYLMEVKQSCTGHERETLQKRAQAMNAHIVFGTADADDHRIAKDLWEKHGKRAAWGCDWFRVWFQRVEEAVRLGQKLRVVYFPGQVGYGKVHWERLASRHTDLWDKNGCGGSQKAEIAKLDQMKRQEELNNLDPSGAWNYEEVDVVRFLSRQFKVGDVVDFKHPESGDFCKGRIVQVPDLSITGLKDPKWRVERARPQQEVETAVVRHTTDFFEKLLKRVGHEAFKTILQEAAGLKITAVHEARLPSGELSLAVSVDMKSIQDAQFLRDKILSDEVILTLNALTNAYQITDELAIDKLQFFDNYARTLLTFSELTPHQKAKLNDLFKHPERNIHLRAPAGAGKTFVALRFLLRKLKSATGEVLYVCPSRALIFHFIQWLLVHAESMSQGVSFGNLLRKLRVMHSPYKHVMAVTIEDSRITLTEQSAQPTELILAVFDEAHEVFRHDSSIFWKVRAKQKMLLSDISQSYSLHEDFPDVPWQAVSLTEVVRSTKRVVLGAGAFRRQDNEKITCLGTQGPPIKTFLFQAPLNGETLLEEFVQKTLEAMRYVMQEYPSVCLERHLALLVPDEQFLGNFKPKLEKCLKHNFSSSCNMIPFEDSLEYLPGVKHWDNGKEAIILDSDGNAKGLEKLIVICIGFDKEIAGSDANFTRAQLYHALTRAQLQAVVVDRLVSGGWCEFLATLVFNGRVFEESDEAGKIRKEAAEEAVAAEESTKATLKDELTEAVQAEGQEQIVEEVLPLPTSVFDTREVSIDVRIKKLEFDPRSSALQVQRGQARCAMISARFDRGPIERQMREVHAKLMKQGFDVMMLPADLGDDFGRIQMVYLNKIKEEDGVLLAVCTEKYGEKTASPYSSHGDVKFCVNHRVEILPLQVQDNPRPRPPWGPHHPYDKNGEAQGLLDMALGPGKLHLDCRNRTTDELVEIIGERLVRP